MSEEDLQNSETLAAHLLKDNIILTSSFQE